MQIKNNNNDDDVFIIKFKPIKIIFENDQIKMQVLFYLGDENKSRQGNIRDYHNKNHIYSPLEIYLAFVTEKKDQKNSSSFFNVESPILAINYSAMIESVKITNQNHKAKGDALFLKGISYMGRSLCCSNDKSVSNETGDIYTVVPVFSKNEKTYGETSLGLARRMAKEDISKIKMNTLYENSYYFWKNMGKRFWFRKTSDKGYSLLLFDFIRIFGVEVNETLSEKEKLSLNKTFSECIDIICDSSKKSDTLKRKLGGNKKVDKKTDLLYKISSCLSKIFFANETSDERQANLIRRYVQVYDIVVHLLFARLLYEECSKLEKNVHPSLSSVKYENSLIEFLSRNLEVGKKAIVTNLENKHLFDNDKASNVRVKKMMLAGLLGSDIKGKQIIVQELSTTIASFSRVIDKINQGEHVFVAVLDLNKETDDEDSSSADRDSPLNKLSGKSQAPSIYDFNLLEKVGLLEKTSLSVWSTSGYLSNDMVISLKKLGKVFGKINKTSPLVNLNDSSEMNDDKIEDVYNTLSKRPISVIPFHFPIHEFAMNLNNLFLSSCLLVSKDTEHSKLCEDKYNITTVTCNDLIEFLNINIDRFTNKPSVKKCLNKIWGINTIDCGCCSWNDTVVQDYLCDIYREYKNSNYMPTPRLTKKRKQTDMHRKMSSIKNIEYLKHIIFLDSEKYGLKEMASLLDYLIAFSLTLPNKTQPSPTVVQVCNKLTFLGDCDSSGTSITCEYQLNLMKFLSKLGNQVAYFSGMHPLYQKFTLIDDRHYERSIYNELGNNFTEREREINTDDLNQHNKYLYPNLVETPLKSIRNIILNASREQQKEGEREEEEGGEEINDKNIEGRDENFDIKEWQITDLFTNTNRPNLLFSDSNSDEDDFSFKYVFVGVDNFSSRIIKEKIEGFGDEGESRYSVDISSNDYNPFYLEEGLQIIIEDRKKKIGENSLSLKIYSEYFKEKSDIDEISNVLFNIVYGSGNSENDEEFGEKGPEVFQDLIDGNIYIKSDHRDIVVEYNKKDEKLTKIDNKNNKNKNNDNKDTDNKSSFEISSISKLEPLGNSGFEGTRKERYILKESHINYTNRRNLYFSNNIPLHISSNDPRIDALPLSMKNRLSTQKVFPVYQSHPLHPTDIIIFFISERTTWNSLTKMIENTNKCVIFIYKAAENRFPNEESVEGEGNVQELLSRSKRYTSYSEQNKASQITTNRYYDIVEMSVQKYIELTKKYYTFIPITQNQK